MTASIPPSTSFTATRINTTTFLITEDDSYAEHPFIYAKLHPSAPLLILSDTGCDSPRDKDHQIVHLKVFLEHHALACNNDLPLNPLRGGRRRDYMIICTHCHYDHIGGIEQFATQHASIVASKHGRSFIEKDLATHSLCKYRRMRTPRYRVSHWAEDREDLKWSFSSLMSKVDLRITTLQTPGHTPDSLAWYDSAERHLYVGDSFYEMGADGMPIIFPKEGDWVTFMRSMGPLRDFVLEQNAVVEGVEEGWVEVLPRVKVGCGHQTAAADAEEMVEAVIGLFERIIAGKVPVVMSEEVRGEVYDLWKEEGEGVRFSVRAPRRLCEEARRHGRGASALT